MIETPSNHGGAYSAKSLVRDLLDSAMMRVRKNDVEGALDRVARAHDELTKLVAEKKQADLQKKQRPYREEYCTACGATLVKDEAGTRCLSCAR